METTDQVGKAVLLDKNYGISDNFISADIRILQHLLIARDQYGIALLVNDIVVEWDIIAVSHDVRYECRRILLATAIIVVEIPVAVSIGRPFVCGGSRIDSLMLCFLVGLLAEVDIVVLRLQVDGSRDRCCKHNSCK